MTVRLCGYCEPRAGQHEPGCPAPAMAARARRMEDRHARAEQAAWRTAFLERVSIPHRREFDPDEEYERVRDEALERGRFQR